MIRSCWTQRALLAQLVRHEFARRYRGSHGGILWSLAQPLAMLVVFTLAFGVLLWRGAGNPAGGAAAYALEVFPGLMLFQALTEVMNKSPDLVTGNPAYVKKIVFPLDLLPVTQALAAWGHALIGLAVWALVYGAYHHHFPLGALWIPALALAFLPALLFFGFLFSALGVFFRDLSQVAGPLGQALLFLSPVLYRIEDLAPRWQAWLYLNPLTFIVEQVRIAMALGAIGNASGLGLYVACAVTACTGAWWFFQRGRRHFADWV
jgi:lipopolysaccharide transport system permease protein